MRFLIDMNLSPLWSNFLAEQGFEATHWSKIGQAGAADIKIFDFAAAGNWIVFTHGSGFRQLVSGIADQQTKRSAGPHAGCSAVRHR